MPDARRQAESQYKAAIAGNYRVEVEQTAGSSTDFTLERMTVS